MINVIITNKFNKKAMNAVMIMARPNINRYGSGSLSLGAYNMHESFGCRWYTILVFTVGYITGFIVNAIFSGLDEYC